MDGYFLKSQQFGDVCMINVQCESTRLKSISLLLNGIGLIKPLTISNYSLMWSQCHIPTPIHFVMMLCSFLYVATMEVY